MEDRVRRLAVCFQRVLGDEVEKLAHEFGLRNRKLKVTEFIATLVLGWWANPQATREELAARAETWFGVAVTPQALSERLSERVAGLLRTLLDRALAQALDLEGEATVLPILNRFAAVFLEDCTSMALPDELEDVSPGCGNQVAGAGRAALKPLVRLEVRSGALATILPAAGREGDATPAQAAPLPPPRSLLLRDLGFFDTEALARLNRARVFWLTRLPTGITLRTGAVGSAAGTGRPARRPRDSRDSVGRPGPTRPRHARLAGRRRPRLPVDRPPLSGRRGQETHADAAADRAAQRTHRQPAGTGARVNGSCW